LAIHYENEDSLRCFIDNIYGGFSDANDKDTYLAERAILAPKNDIVDEINDAVLKEMNTEGMIFLSADSVESSGSDENACNFPVEFLNTLNISAFPAHRLEIKVGCPIVLLRNICSAQGLCNGTRLIVTNLSRRLITARILNGSQKKKVVFIPRITLIHESGNNSRLPFDLKRHQFPVRVAFSMTINKAQGQTLSHLGVYLPTPVFAHGQLYVALSRATKRESVKMLVANGKFLGHEGIYTKNVVYRSIFSDN